MGLKYPVVLLPDEDEGGFCVQVYDIPAAISQGENKGDALGASLDVLKEVLEWNHFEKDRPVPLPSCLEDITLDDIRLEGITLGSGVLEYLAYLELPEELGQKILEHNRLCGAA